MEAKLKTTFHCPGCGHEKEEIMPENSCVYFYQCEKCHKTIKPKQGDCCVFCSYGTTPCPSKQMNNGCCK